MTKTFPLTVSPLLSRAVSKESAMNDILYIFIIDTNLYAGNFEREMCGYVTGEIGECGVGREEAEIFRSEVNEDEFSYIIKQSNEDGCPRPVSIWPTEGRWNNGSGSHFNDDEFDPALSWKGVKWPAYESVAIFFKIRPTEDQIELMKGRAEAFTSREAGLKILGYRLITRTTTVTDEMISI